MKSIKTPTTQNISKTNMLFVQELLRHFPETYFDCSKTRHSLTTLKLFDRKKNSNTLVFFYSPRDENILHFVYQTVVNDMHHFIQEETYQMLRSHLRLMPSSYYWVHPIMCKLYLYQNQIFKKTFKKSLILV